MHTIGHSKISLSDTQSSQDRETHEFCYLIPAQGMLALLTKKNDFG